MSDNSNVRISTSSGGAVYTQGLQADPSSTVHISTGSGGSAFAQGMKTGENSNVHVYVNSNSPEAEAEKKRVLDEIMRRMMGK